MSYSRAGLGALPGDWYDVASGGSLLSAKYINKVAYPDGSIGDAQALIAQATQTFGASSGAVTQLNAQIAQRAWGFIAGANANEPYAGVTVAYAGVLPATGAIATVGGTSAGPVTQTITPTGVTTSAPPGSPPIPGPTAQAPEQLPPLTTPDNVPATGTSLAPSAPVSPTGNPIPVPPIAGEDVPPDGTDEGGGGGVARASMFSSPWVIGGLAIAAFLLLRPGRRSS